jgi:hypothetical protein
VRVDEDQAVRLRQTGERIVAFRQFVRPAAVGGSPLRDRLVEARRGAAAAVTPEQDLRDASLLSDRGLTASTMNPRLASSRAEGLPSTFEVRWMMRIATRDVGPLSGWYSAPLTGDGENWMYVGWRRFMRCLRCAYSRRYDAPILRRPSIVSSNA